MSHQTPLWVTSISRAYRLTNFAKELDDDGLVLCSNTGQTDSCSNSATEQSTQQWCADFPDLVGSLLIINNIPFNSSRWKQDAHCFCESSQHSTLWASLTWQNVTKWLCGRLPQEGHRTDMLHFTRCLLRRLWRHSLLQGAFSEDSGAVHLHPPHPHYHLQWHFLTGLWKAAREEWLCLLPIGDWSKLYGTCGISKCLRIPALQF